MSQALITSPDNARIRALKKLASSRRDRRKAGRTLLDGVHLLQAYRDRGGQPDEVFVSSGGRSLAGIEELLAGVPAGRIIELSDPLFRHVSTVDSPTGVLAVIPIPATRRPLAIDGACVYLEDIQDPGNLGSILRSCAAAGIRDVLLSGQSVDAWSPRVLRAGMGAHFLLAIHEGADAATLVDALPGRIVATHHHAQRSVFDAELRGNVCMAFGNEGAGLSRPLLEAAATVVAIPMPGATESLNIAAAAAVCLFERVRQTQAGGSTVESVVPESVVPESTAPGVPRSAAPEPDATGRR